MNYKIINAGSGFLVVLCALILVCFILFTDSLPGLVGWKKTTLILIVLLYAFFRGYRAFMMIKYRNEED